MRFIGIVFVLGAAVGVSLVADALGVIVCPVYFLVVMVSVIGTLLMAYGYRTSVDSVLVYWRRTEKTSAEYALYARVHATARKTAVASGIMAMLIGTAATLGAVAPEVPQVARFASSFAGPIFGILCGYLLHEPMAAFFRVKAKG